MSPGRVMRRQEVLHHPHFVLDPARREGDLVTGRIKGKPADRTIDSPNG